MISADAVKRIPHSPDKSNQNDGNCDICCEEINYFAIGACDHPICYRCSGRMRVLSKQTYCATCRAEMDKVIISFQSKKFASFNLSNLKSRRYRGFYFEDIRLMDEFESLFDYTCVDCSHKEKFGSFDELKTHIRRIHEKQFCQICVDTLSNFSGELKMYTRKEMVSHRKDGDEKDRSHRGHPECRFCNDRFFDNDTLLLHLRKSHFWCHFCEHDGKQEYYNVYCDLRKHFADTHYLCDEGLCRNEKYTCVFRDKIDYQAHKLASHGKNLNKIQAKEARKINIDYSYRKRQQNSIVSGGDNDELQKDVRYTRNSDVQRRDDRKKMDYSNFEDIEKERKELQKEKIRKYNNEKQSGRSVEEVSEAAATSCTSETNENYRQGYNVRNDDDDVIGLVEHINKSEMDEITNVNTVNKPVLSKSHSSPENNGVLKEKIDVDNKISGFNETIEEFPSLNGEKVTNVHLPVKKTKEEEYPSLGKPLTYKIDDLKKDNNWVSNSEKNGFNVIRKIEKKVIKADAKEKGKSWTQQSGRGNFSSDFPSLNSTTKESKVPPSEFNENWKDMASENGPASKLKFPHQPQNAVDNCVKKDNKGGDCMNGRQKKKLLTVSKEPPGLASGARKKEFKPPGFSGVSSNRMENNTHERNMRLVAMLQTYLDNFNLQLFKKLSGEFRNDLKSASIYYSDISELLGDNLKCVFSELVALLPDENKREELLKVHQNAKVLAKQKSESKQGGNSPVVRQHKVWGASSAPPQRNVSCIKETVTQCVDCGQTIPKDEVIEHMESHGEAFPSLPTAIKKKNNFSVQKAHQYNAKNPWAK